MLEEKTTASKTQQALPVHLYIHYPPSSWEADAVSNLGSDEEFKSRKVEITGLGHMTPIHLALDS